MPDTDTVAIADGSDSDNDSGSDSGSDSLPPRTELGVKIVVSERHGIRRFLYPLAVRLPSLYRRSAGKLALCDEQRGLVPAHTYVDPAGNVRCVFAASLGPWERRELQLARLAPGEVAPVPDPMRARPVEGGGVATDQERVRFTLGADALPSSVVYDDVEHLAGPLVITLDGRTPEPPGDAAGASLRIDGALGLDYSAPARYAPGAGGGSLAEASAAVELTCCKSWATARFALREPRPGARVRFRLPLRVTSDTAVCDFGAGQGAYARLQPGGIDAVEWENRYDAAGGARYEIAVVPAGAARRVDYAGEMRPGSELTERLWLHWTEPTKALALAVTRVPRGVERVGLRCGADGVIDAEFQMSPASDEPTAEFGVCYHFLNAVPAIAAATNPASILLPPRVTVARSGE